MDDSTFQPDNASAPATPDNIRLRRWFMVYGVYLLALAVPLGLLIAAEAMSLKEFVGNFRTMDAAIKLLAFAIYMSVCSTFFPLPTGPIVAAIALAECAVGTNVWTTSLLVAGVGAAGSTAANLNDYHLFTWLLRSRRVQRVRETRIYHASARWFARAPFAILVVFNILPIPIDVIRVLATTYRYPRLPFAAANFVGRFIRYAIIAAVTYQLGERGWISVAVLTGIAIILLAERSIGKLLRRRREQLETVQ